MHEITKIRENILHVQEASNTCFTVIAGSERALILDTGHGVGRNREFIESLIATPYTVINTHGHPDHTQGNWQFDEVWMHPLDLPAFDDANAKAQRGRNADRLIGNQELDPEDRQAFIDRPVTRPLPLTGSEHYDLGDLHPYLVMLPGHSKGSVGVVVPEYRLLLSGDAFGPDMWMFAANHDTLETLRWTLEYALTLPVDMFMGTHMYQETDIAAARDLIDTLDHGVLDTGSKKIMFGDVTYKLRYQGKVYKDCAINVTEEDAQRFLR